MLIPTGALGGGEKTLRLCDAMNLSYLYLTIYFIIPRKETPPTVSFSRDMMQKVD